MTEVIAEISEPGKSPTVTEFKQYHGATGWILTHSGRKLNPLRLTPEDVDIEDIAHSLSMQCRWSGHTKSFYTVGQHCYLVSLEADEQDQLWGLLHDASEAYLVDLPSPIKRQMAEYNVAEERAMSAICARFGLPPFMPRSVHVADETLLATEYRDLMPHHPEFPKLRTPRKLRIVPLSQPAAKETYLRRFDELASNVKFYRRLKEATSVWDPQDLSKDTKDYIAPQELLSVGPETCSLETLPTKSDSESAD